MHIPAVVCTYSKKAFDGDSYGSLRPKTIWHRRFLIVSRSSGPLQIMYNLLGLILLYFLIKFVPLASIYIFGFFAERGDLLSLYAFSTRPSPLPPLVIYICMVAPVSNTMFVTFHVTAQHLSFSSRARKWNAIGIEAVGSACPLLSGHARLAETGRLRHASISWPAREASGAL